MARTIEGGTVGTIAGLRKSLKKGGGGYLTRVPAQDGMTARFLTEPDEWVKFFEHYDEIDKFTVCTQDCVKCAENGTKGRSKRYLTNAVDMSDGKVVPLVLPASLAEIMLKRYDKFQTLLDRDYELERTGTGLDTSYDALPQAPRKVNLARFKKLDLWAKLMEQLPDDSDEEEDDEEDEAPRRRKVVSRPVAKTVTRRKIARSEVDEDAPVKKVNGKILVKRRIVR
jgi:hypothetical protein